MLGSRFLWWKTSSDDGVQQESSASNNAVNDNNTLAENKTVIVSGVETWTKECIVEVSSGGKGDQRPLLEDSVLTTARTSMATPGPTSPPPPPLPLLPRTSPLAPSTPPPSPTALRSLPLPAVTSEKATQSPPPPPGPSEIAQTVRSVLTSTTHAPKDTSSGPVLDISTNEAVRTSALVHADNREVLARSLATLKASPLPTVMEQPSCDGTDSGSGNTQVGRDAPVTNSCDVAAGGGDASLAAALNTASAESPQQCAESKNCTELKNLDDGLKNNNEDGSVREERMFENNFECCVYYSVQCCECVVL